MHLLYEDFQYDGRLLSSSADYDSGCASHAKQTNTSSGSSTPGGGEPHLPQGIRQSGGQTNISGGSANDGGNGRP
ncbi:hypothetical protein EDD85DRAFT_961285 [Armillaria nabsnona]|nr:hypothetical protein EDD85DRAFT_961285 [Armillaria nabsnona]